MAEKDTYSTLTSQQDSNPEGSDPASSYQHTTESTLNDSHVEIKPILIEPIDKDSNRLPYTDSAMPNMEQQLQNVQPLLQLNGLSNVQHSQEMPSVDETRHTVQAPKVRILKVKIPGHSFPGQKLTVLQNLSKIRLQPRQLISIIRPGASILKTDLHSLRSAASVTHPSTSLSTPSDTTATSSVTMDTTDNIIGIKPMEMHTVAEDKTNRPKGPDKAVMEKSRMTHKNIQITAADDKTNQEEVVEKQVIHLEGTTGVVICKDAQISPANDKKNQEEVVVKQVIDLEADTGASDLDNLETHVDDHQAPDSEGTVNVKALIWQKCLSQAIAQFWLQQHLCDVQFVTKDFKKVFAHSLVLGASSDDLFTMLENAPIHNGMRTLFLQGVSGITAKTLSLVLRFIYFGEVPVPYSEVLRLCRASRYLGLHTFYNRLLEQTYNTETQHKHSHEYITTQKEDSTKGEKRKNEDRLSTAEAKRLKSEALKRNAVVKLVRCDVGVLVEVNSAINSNEVKRKEDSEQCNESNDNYDGAEEGINVADNEYQPGKNEKKHTCDLCFKSFSSEEALKMHEKVHTGDKPYFCKLCGQEFVTCDMKIIREQEMLPSPCVHRVVRKAYRHHRCKTCGRNYHRRYQLMQHIQQSHSGVKPHKCDTCGKQFAYKSSLTNHHIAVHTKFRPHKCEICGKNFALRQLLLRHVDTHSGVKHKCDTCGNQFIFQHNLVRHLRRFHLEVKPHKCEVCNKTFQDQKDLNKHQKEQGICKNDDDSGDSEDKKTYLLQTADSASHEMQTLLTLGKTKMPANENDNDDGEEDGRAAGKLQKTDTTKAFSTPRKERDADGDDNDDDAMESGKAKDFRLSDTVNESAEQKEMVNKSSLDQQRTDTHTNDRPHQCHQCGKAFVRKTSLSQHHRMVHAGYRPHRRGFGKMVSKARLTQQTNCRPHKCDICGKQFAFKCRLTLHHRVVHTNYRPHRCEICGKKFALQHVLLRHVDTHSGVKRHKCDTNILNSLA